jgi:hypothetical protein
MPTKNTCAGAPKNLVLLQISEGLLLFCITQLGFCKRHGFASTNPKGSNSTHSVLPKSTQNKTQNHDTHMVSLLKIFPKQTKKNGNQSPTYRKMNFSMFGCRENARKRRPLALPASGRDPPASGAVVHPQRWLAHLASISGSLQLSLQLSRPPSPISLSRSLSGKKEKSEKKDARGEH